MTDIAGMANIISRDATSAAQLRAGEAKINQTKQLRKANGEVDPKIEKAAQEFESVFISQMLQHMFEGVKTDETFGGGEAEDIYKSMMMDEYGKLISRTGGIGLADHVKREMISMQEVE